MKIQFIVCGWWYDEWDGKKNQTEFIDALYELKEENDNLDVMQTCHKTPPKIITEKFDYKEYEKQRYHCDEKTFIVNQNYLFPIIDEKNCKKLQEGKLNYFEFLRVWKNINDA